MTEIKEDPERAGLPIPDMVCGSLASVSSSLPTITVEGAVSAACPAPRPAHAPHSAHHSPVAKFLPRLLRNSFSKIRRRGSLSFKSRSAELAGRTGEEEDRQEEAAASDVISPIDEEMVAMSRREGLPLIPFGYPNFVILDKKLEETKQLIRENSLKEVRAAAGPRLRAHSTAAELVRDHQHSPAQSLTSRNQVTQPLRKCQVFVYL